MYQTLQQALSGPETDWIEAANRCEKESEAHDSVAGKLVAMVITVVNGAVTAEERQRTKLRIAVLSLKAVRYKWEMGELPKSIDQFADAEERCDPSGSGEFAYRKENDWFRIVRTSKDDLGDVRLGPKPVQPQQPDASGQP